MSEKRPAKAAPLTNVATRVGPIVLGTRDQQLTPHDRIIMALEASPRGPRRCPSCPEGKFGGFKVTESKTERGFPLVFCHRGCTFEEILGAVGLDSAGLFDGSGHAGQTELFDANRFAIVERAGWKAMPPSAGRHFGLAGSHAQYVTAAGSYARVRGSGKVVAYFLDRRHAHAARLDCGLSPSTWRTYVAIWKKVHMAHRCPPSHGGVLALFRHPELTCPNCGGDVELGESVYQDQRERLPGPTPLPSVSAGLSTKASTRTNGSRSFHSKGVGGFEGAVTDEAGKRALLAPEPAGQTLEIAAPPPPAGPCYACGRSWRAVARRATASTCPACAWVIRGARGVS